MDVIKLKSLEEKELVPGYFARIIHSENMSVVFWDVKAGYSLPKHSHKQEQICTVIKGEFILDVGGKSYLMKAEEVFVIPSDVPHAGKAVNDCKLIDTFFPVREDYK
jgi:quercetin dioxygenase-like cupin family protein